MRCFGRLGLPGRCLRTPASTAGLDLRHRGCNVQDNDGDHRSLARRAGDSQVCLLSTGLVWTSSIRNVKSTFPTGEGHHYDATIEAGGGMRHQLRSPRRTGGVPLSRQEIPAASLWPCPHRSASSSAR
jgi:hypothetical protein